MQGVDASRRRLGMTICLDFNSGTESTDHSSEESNGPDDGDALDTMNASLQAMALSLSLMLVYWTPQFLIRISFCQLLQ